MFNNGLTLLSPESQLRDISSRARVRRVPHESGQVGPRWRTVELSLEEALARDLGGHDGQRSSSWTSSEDLATSESLAGADSEVRREASPPGEGASEGFGLGVSSGGRPFVAALCMDFAKALNLKDRLFERAEDAEAAEDPAEVAEVVILCTLDVKWALSLVVDADELADDVDVTCEVIWW